MNGTKSTKKQAANKTKTQTNEAKPIKENSKENKELSRAVRKLELDTGYNHEWTSIDDMYDYGEYTNKLIGLHLSKNTLISAKPIGHIIQLLLTQRLSDSNTLTVGDIKKILVWATLQNCKKKSVLYDELMHSIKNNNETDTKALTKFLQDFPKIYNITVTCEQSHFTGIEKYIDLKKYKIADDIPEKLDLQGLEFGSDWKANWDAVIHRCLERGYIMERYDNVQ